MTTTKEIKINIALTDEEVETIHKAKTILEEVLCHAQDNNCGTILCSGEYTYDISDLERVVDDLDMFESIDTLVE